MLMHLLVVLVAVYLAKEKKAASIKFALDHDRCVSVFGVQTQKVFVGIHFAAVNTSHFAFNSLVNLQNVLFLFSQREEESSAFFVEIAPNGLLVARLYVTH